MYLGILSSFSQAGNTDSTAYKPRKLHLDEINFVSGYYRQDGNHSAVTGGIGTEKLTDIANTLEVKISKYDKKLRKHSIGLELGVDHYSSASSDKIDFAMSSASSSDTRFYPTLSWSVLNDVKGTTFGLNASMSKEFDYKSAGFGASFSKRSKDRNREFSAKLQTYFDKWSVIYPVEFRVGFPNTGSNGISGHSPRKSYTLSLGLSQVINQKLQLVFVAEPTLQDGLLATKYQRVYFKDGSEQPENLPDKRIKIPVGIRANYFAGDRFILRAFYRYYQDDWGMNAHTFELETPVKITPFISVSPFYRYYTQNEIDYFAAYREQDLGAKYFTSDYDLSTLNSSFFGANFRIIPAHGVFGIKAFNNLELRYGHYMRSDKLKADQISLHLQFKY